MKAQHWLKWKPDTHLSEDPLVEEGKKRIIPLKVVFFRCCAPLEGVPETVNSFSEII